MTLLFLSVAMSVFAKTSEPVLVFLGDSLTAGYGLPEYESYPFKIQEKLKADGLPFKVVNAGISGDTTHGGLGRLPWVLRAKPDLVCVALGANDGLRGLDVSLSRKNLETIIERLQEAGVGVILIGNLLPTNYGENYLESFKNIFKEIAEKYALPFYPFLLEGVGGVEHLNLADGIHPNAAGYTILANNLYSFLKPVLQAFEVTHESG